MAKPEYKHDCRDCKFHGHFDGYDIYTCGKWPTGSIIARRSDDGSDYDSLRMDCVSHHSVGNEPYFPYWQEILADAEYADNAEEELRRETVLSAAFWLFFTFVPIVVGLTVFYLAYSK